MQSILDLLCHIYHIIIHTNELRSPFPNTIQLSLSSHISFYLKYRLIQIIPNHLKYHRSIPHLRESRYEVESILHILCSRTTLLILSKRTSEGLSLRLERGYVMNFRRLVTRSYSLNRSEYVSTVSISGVRQIRSYSKFQK